jgi:hypothetical protein
MQDDTWCRTMGVTKEQKVSRGQGLFKTLVFGVGRLDGPLVQRVLGGSHIVTAHVLKLQVSDGGVLCLVSNKSSFVGQR